MIILYFPSCYSCHLYSTGADFWATICKTVHHMLSDRSVCLSGCDVGVLWPNGWMDQDEIWHGGRPRPRRHCIRKGRSPPPQKKGGPQFSAHVCCGQTAGWIKMPLGTDVGLGAGNIVLDRDTASPKRGTAARTTRPMSIVAKRLDRSRCHLVRT